MSAARLYSPYKGKSRTTYLESVTRTMTPLLQILNHPVMVLTFPPRELSPLERELAREWLARAGDVLDCHVSSRRSDDPAFHRRIVVTDAQDGRPTHLIHHPDGLDLWVKMTVGPYSHFEMFPTLTAALNSIRRVLVVDEQRG
jgi:hypothetical protein